MMFSNKRSSPNELRHFRSTTHVFGQPRPASYKRMLSTGSATTEVFLPSGMTLENYSMNLINSRQTCYASFDDNETDYMSQWPGHHLLACKAVVVVPEDSGKEYDIVDKWDPCLAVEDTNDSSPEAETLMDTEVDEAFESFHLIEQSDAPKEFPFESNFTSPSKPEAASPPPSPRRPPVHSNDYYIYGEYALPRPPDSTPIKLYMIMVIEIVLKGINNNTLIVEKKPFRIHQQQLECFAPNNWLEDDVVDYYLSLLTERNNKDCAKYAKIYTFFSSFYALLGSAKGLQIVEQTAEGDNIFEYDLIYFPVCQNHHWRLIVVDVKKGTVSSYNSMQSRPDQLIVKNIVRYLKHEYKRLHPNVEPGDQPEWELRMNLNVPQQDNGYDCGVFMLEFADYLSNGKEFTFEAVHMSYFRAKLLYECISGRLLH